MTAPPGYEETAQGYERSAAAHEEEAHRLEDQAYKAHQAAGGGDRARQLLADAERQRKFAANERAKAARLRETNGKEPPR